MTRTSQIAGDLKSCCRKLLCSVVLLAGLLAAFGVLAEARVKDVRVAENGATTRVVLDLDQNTQHLIFPLSNPDRVVIDVMDSKLASKAQRFPEGAGSVTKVRGSHRENGSTRLVLEVSSPVTTSSFMLPPSGKQGHRLVVDLTSAGAAVKAPVKQQSVRVIKSVAPIVGQERDLIIAIDAGHGGKDPGARGKKGLREKDVVLAIAKRMARMVNDEPGMRAVLIREGDQFISLRGRIEKAHKYNADLFLSIHADSFKDSRVRGSTVYVLSERGASDEHARHLADRENAADLIGNVSLSDKNATLASVLLDLSQNAAIGASFDVGSEVIQELGSVGKVRKSSVQQARFLVLKSPDIPSILIETAYISNPTDEKNLGSSNHQNKIARALFHGVKDYFYKNPPVGTKVARLSRDSANGAKYVVQRGDTLSEIANRHNVSLTNIRDANGLRGDRIRVGQVIQIPSRQRT
jgi:N-acetylmuramoyl-L-alanine amidase